MSPAPPAACIDMQPLSVCLALCLAFGGLSGCGDAASEAPLSTNLIAMTDKFFDVEALSTERAVVVGYAGKILLTTDGGRHWQAQDSGTNAALYSIACPPDGDAPPTQCWISGQDGTLLHSADQGETWQAQDSGIGDSIFGIHFIDTVHGWAAADRATYLKTADGGATWQNGYIQPSLEGVAANATLALTDPIFYDVQFLDENEGWMVGEFGKIYHTADGGETWQEQQNSLLGQLGFTDALNLPTFFGLSFADADHGIAVGLEGKIVATTDGGRQWRFVNREDDGETGAALFDTEPLYAPYIAADGAGGWIVGAAGRVLRMRDGEWQQASVGMPIATWLRAVDFHDADHGWIVGGYGSILRTTDGGANWLRVFG